MTILDKYIILFNCFNAFMFVLFFMLLIPCIYVHICSHNIVLLTSEGPREDKC